MINFHKEINNYFAVSKLSDSTLKKYTTELLDFCFYLSERLQCEPSEVMLDKIYTLKTSTNNIIGYKAIDARVIDTYLFQYTESGYSLLSNKTHAVRSFFKYLKNNRNFPDIIPYSKLKLSHYKPQAIPIRILSRHEFLRFLHSLVSHSNDLIRDLMLFGLLFTTGCRISELLNLKSSDVNSDEEMIFLQKTKTKVQRVVVLREGFGVVFKEYIRNNTSHFLFTKVQGGQFQPMTGNDINQLFKTFLNKAKLPPMRIHSSRHSFATYMRDAGIDLFTIMELLGHEKFQSTLHYTQPHYYRNRNIKIKQHEEVYSHLRSIINELED
ncbi:hypothetical protein BVG16_07610 [Paenibacillus selenitireducens]|uniref:Tyr recombinase domain-containing protein n=1 Tax=Paenibacillus selenitireducens TaxID=1324314 RepID=A0A1T2XL86_9BACL|nr:site-specific integrase [Paenibacillus selenitireducens]OPA80578.1 hypothetical protein BVG16_07610 [Paenibacillus selenitireducens]